jgi:hypothetical protein
LRFALLSLRFVHADLNVLADHNADYETDGPSIPHGDTVSHTSFDVRILSELGPELVELLNPLVSDMPPIEMDASFAAARYRVLSDRSQRTRAALTFTSSPLENKINCRAFLEFMADLCSRRIGNIVCGWTPEAVSQYRYIG